MAFTRKHYVAVAEIIADAKQKEQDYKKVGFDVREFIALELANMFDRDTDRFSYDFNYDHFLLACEVK